MIDRQKGKILIECDFCDEVFEGDSDEFIDVWSAAKREGWKSRRMVDEWLHCCSHPQCQTIVARNIRRVDS